MIPMDFPFITNKKIFSYAKNKISFTNNISSTARTPEEQVNAMYNNLKISKHVIMLLQVVQWKVDILTNRKC
jgi:hypothetical protein